MTAGALQCLYGDRWQITFDDVRWVWMAERREGTALRILAGREPGDLAVKIEAAERSAGQ